MASYYLGSTDGVPQNARAFRRFIRRHFPSLTIMLLAVMLVGTFLFPFIVITVPSGQVGVLWKRFNSYALYCWCFVGRGTIVDPRDLALGQIISLQSATAVQNADLQRNQQRWRCRQCPDQHALSVAAQLRRRAA